MAEKEGGIMEDILKQSGVTEEERLGLDGQEQEQEQDKGTPADQGEEQPVKEERVEQEEQPVKQAKEPQKDRQTLKGPKPLLDKDGRQLVEGGAQRRLFEKYRHSHEVEIPALRREIQAFKEASSYKEHGLTPAEAVSGYALVKAWKEDPARLISHLLTQAKAAGIKVDAGGGSVDLAAIKQMISEATKPLADAQAAREARGEVDRKVRDTYDRFMASHPDASAHEEEIALLLDRNPDLNLEAAYYELRLHFQKNGLDWSQPLRGQIKRAPANGSPPRSRLRTETPVNGDGEEQDPTPMPASSSYSDIIKASMRENGYKI
jgi:hypothetical protein